MTLKIAIVGTGKVARNNYLPYLAEQPDVTLSYYSRTPAKAHACAVDFGGRVMNTLPEIIADQPDAVLVLTREEQRYDVTVELIRLKPKRLFFEKPLVAQHGQDKVCEDDFIKARDLMRKANIAGVETAMVFNYRFFDQTQRALQMVRDRHFGSMLQAALFVNYACWSHCIDLLHLFGGRAVRISAFSGDIAYQNAVDVTAAFILENGTTGSIVGTNGCDFNFPLYIMIFNYQHGLLHFSDLDVDLRVYETNTRYAESHTVTGHHSRWDQYKISFEKSLGAYLESLRKGTLPPVPGTAGLEELQFEAALRRSITLQRPVDVQKEFPLEI
ncbi:MAG: Gfo/Idh/MocA family oxidoreductase [Anaerolineae bacterium]|nr:Gfo/Idh/MocA family oxidoreductase [Anaerolineae bacterium]